MRTSCRSGQTGLVSGLIQRALWIGGSPCSGKSTVAREIAARINSTVYACDEAFERHAERVDPDHGPVLKKVSLLNAAERLAQDLDVQVVDVFELYRDEFPWVK